MQIRPLVEALSAAGATLADLRMLRTAAADTQERMLDNLGVQNPVWRMRLVFAASAVPDETDAASASAAGRTPQAPRARASPPEEDPLAAQLEASEDLGTI